MKTIGLSWVMALVFFLPAFSQSRSRSSSSSGSGSSSGSSSSSSSSSSYSGTGSSNPAPNNPGGAPKSNPAPGPNNPNPPAPNDSPTVPWLGTLPEALKNNNEKPLLIYVHTLSDNLEPAGFRAPDIVRALADKFVCVKLAYSKDDAALARYALRSFPVLLGTDRYGNEFRQFSGRPGAEELRGFFTQLLEAIEKFERQLKEDLAKGQEMIDGKEFEKGLEKLIPIAGSNRKGYPEVKVAGDRVRSAADASFAQAGAWLKDLATEKQGVTLLESMARWFKGTEFCNQARLRLAQHCLAKGEVPRSISWVKQVSGDKSSDDSSRESAARLLADIVERGMARLREQLSHGEQGLEVIRLRVKEIQQEFEGTEAGLQATEVLKDLSR